jgi:TatD DNase family protein
LDVNSLNFRIGITGPVTYKNAERLREVAASIPEEFLLVETDAPFLTPHPHRGERNEPAFVQYIIERIASIRQTNIETVTEITSLNAERLFRW